MSIDIGPIETPHHLSSCIVSYCKTNSIDSNTVIKTFIYDEKLDSVIRHIENSIELKSIDAITDTVTSLYELDANRIALQLDKFDCIYVDKHGKIILKLENEKNPDTGNSLYMIIKRIDTQNDTIPWLQIATFLGVWSLAIYTYYTSL